MSFDGGHINNSPAVTSFLLKSANHGQHAALLNRRSEVPSLFCCVMRSKIEIYRAKATECEVRAQEMPPGLRRTFLTLAEYWRKLAFDAAEAADRRRKQIQEAEDRREKRTKVS